MRAIFLLLLVYRVAADTAGYIGWGVAALVAIFWFDTPVQVVLLASVAGLVASLPITLVMGASILQISVMQETGAVARVVASAADTPAAMPPKMSGSHPASMPRP